MHPFTQKYVLAHIIKPLPDDYTYSMQNWPLHVTLADVFSIESNLTEFLSELQAELATVDAFNVAAVDETKFGADASVPVVLLDTAAPLMQLHKLVITIAGRHGAAFNNPEYTLDGFRPHATKQKTERLQLGEVITFNSITLIDMFPDKNPYKRRILATIPLAKPTLAPEK